MLDLHCHILPEVDDGAASLDEALAMARFCVRDGITHVVATPHCHRLTRLLRADILPHVARLNEELARAGIPADHPARVGGAGHRHRRLPQRLRGRPILPPGRRPRLHAAGVPLEGGAVPGRRTGAGLLAP